jgi:adenylate cyclase
MHDSSSGNALIFGNFVIDPGERQLLIDGKPTKIGSRAFHLLTSLVERRGRVVSKDELLELVWPKLVVEENTLQVHISTLRRILGPQAITTVPGRGYSFTLELTPGGDSSSRPLTPQHNLRAAICVLPFVNMSGDPDQEYFSDGITEDIITDLSKVSALAVTSRNSAFVFKGKPVDVPKVARELKVDHVLEGSVRKAGGRVRITAQLVNASSNDHVWAERYDRDLNDIFALQDEISEAIVKALKLKLLPGERRAIQQRGTDNIEAYDLYLMARLLYVTSHEGDERQAEGIVRLCDRATEIDPNYARAWALLGLGQVILRFLHSHNLDGGLAAAERALALDPTLAEAHAVKARIYSEDGRYDAASTEIDAALRLDPDSYEVNRSAAYLRYRQHRPDDAARYFEKAMTILDTDMNSGNMLICCYNAVGDSQAVARVAKITLAQAEARLKQDPNNVAAVRYGAHALAAQGEFQRFKQWMKRALLLDPDNIKSRYNFACTLTAHLKETDAAMELLEPIFENVSSGLLNHAKADPDLDSLRDDPKFRAMIEAADERLAARAQRC